jgi:uncharacterized protein involved in response to NO
VPWAGPSLFAYGFRPFFLAAASWAAIALPLWLASLGHEAALPTAFAPMAWHAHEMLFGFAMAAMAGFMLTAIPNWTGSLPLGGWPLAGLAGLWLVGRLAMLTSAWIGPLAAALLDLAFPAVLLAAVAREIVAGRSWRNLPVCAALAAVLAANLLTHLEPLSIAGTGGLGQRLAIGTLAMLVALIGGRIVPSFTANALKRQGAASLPAPFGRFDKALLAASLVAIFGWAVAPTQPWVGALLIPVGLAHGVRLYRWRPLATRREPLLWVLHLGYAWLALGLVLVGADAVRGTFGEHLHALTAGCFATMILAVMTRATLGHTGRALVAGPATTVIYALASIAALTRVVAHAFPAAYLPLVSMAGLAWIAAFGLFLAVYGPMLLRPRPDGRPG